MAGRAAMGVHINIIIILSTIDFDTEPLKLLDKTLFGENQEKGTLIIVF